jgi:deoxycytidine triphosphate deaminase
MYLSNRDIKWAMENGRLLCTRLPEDMGAGYDETSIDLHLDTGREAFIWDIESFQASEDARGRGAPELHIGRFNWGRFSRQYLIHPPEDSRQPVYRRGPEIIVKPSGFLLWQTKERIGTPKCIGSARIGTSPSRE